MTDKPDNWMPLYIGRYLQATTRLTREQHGAYFLLIMDSWINGPPPDEDPVLAAIVKASAKEWRLLRPTMQPFFTVTEGKWVHGKVERERLRAALIIEKRKKAGAAGGNAARGKSGRKGNSSEIANAITEEIANDTPEELQNNTPLPLPQPVISEAKASSIKSRARKRVDETPGFIEFYEIFPLHKARGAAAIAYASALTRASAEQLLDGAKRYAKERAHEDKNYTKYPATWLKQDCWLDETVSRETHGGRNGGHQNKPAHESFAAGLSRSIQESDRGGGLFGGGSEIIDITPSSDQERDRDAAA